MITLETELEPIDKIILYERGYFCSGIVFNPEFEHPNKYPKGIAPHIEMTSDDGDTVVYFEIPESIAYYAYMHRGFTNKGRAEHVEEGRREIRAGLKSLLKL